MMLENPPGQAARQPDGWRGWSVCAGNCTGRAPGWIQKISRVACIYWELSGNAIPNPGFRLPRSLPPWALLLRAFSADIVWL